MIQEKREQITKGIEGNIENRKSVVGIYVQLMNTYKEEAKMILENINIIKRNIKTTRNIIEMSKEEIERREKENTEEAKNFVKWANSIIKKRQEELDQNNELLKLTSIQYENTKKIVNENKKIIKFLEANIQADVAKFDIFK